MEREVLRLTFVEGDKIALLALKISLSPRKKWNRFKMTRRIRFPNLSSVKSKTKELLRFDVFAQFYEKPKVSIKFDCVQNKKAFGIFLQEPIDYFLFCQKELEKKNVTEFHKITTILKILKINKYVNYFGTSVALVNMD